MNDDRGLATLPALASQIATEHAAAQSAYRQAVAHAIAVGRLLATAKAECGHGHFENWVRDNCPFSPRTARAYMQAARQLPELPDEKRQRVAELPLREVFAMLAQPETDGDDDRAIAARIQAADDAVTAAMTAFEESGFIERCEDLGTLQRIIQEMERAAMMFARRRVRAEIECGRLLRELALQEREDADARR
ncbi:DUF3102 domain-containing protein [Cupriavidus pinatubonensis]|uniref:DUF3102 domain-containing protein n=1 Tax=Cupriavidus pinatubonensis TaxID=248026 RepID=UPI0015E471CC|nr:DUF3102 domain-containing protein [Cupriavidus pinatubonensis]